jgi:hypothetical protein
MASMAQSVEMHTIGGRHRGIVFFTEKSFKELFEDSNELVIYGPYPGIKLQRANVSQIWKRYHDYVKTASPDKKEQLRLFGRAIHETFNPLLLSLGKSLSKIVGIAKKSKVISISADCLLLQSKTRDNIKITTTKLFLRTDFDALRQLAPSPQKPFVLPARQTLLLDSDPKKTVERFSRREGNPCSFIVTLGEGCPIVDMRSKTHLVPFSGHYFFTCSDNQWYFSTPFFSVSVDDIYTASLNSLGVTYKDTDNSECIDASILALSSSSEIQISLLPHNNPMRIFASPLPEKKEEKKN